MEIRSHWQRIFYHPILLVSILAVVLAIPRFIWLLNGKYSYIILLFLLMWIFPFIFLTREGRKSIGIRKPDNLVWVLSGFLLGVVASLLIYIIGVAFFGKSSENWYVTIMNSFNKDNLIESIKPNIGLFLLISFPSMIFSPIGEEFFFRGMIQDSYAAEVGNQKATLIDAAFFGVTHLAHHGLILQDGILRFYPSSILWVLLMVLVSILFSFIRNKSGSIWGAVVCHAGFNLGMMGCIFYLLHE